MKDGRSTIDGYFSWGSTMIYSMSRKQDTISLNNVEVEYIVACEVGKEAI